MSKKATPKPPTGIQTKKAQPKGLKGSPGVPRSVRTTDAGRFAVKPSRMVKRSTTGLAAVLDRNGVDASEREFVDYLDDSFAAAGSGIAALSTSEREALNRITADLPERNTDDEPAAQRALMARLAADRATYTFSSTLSTGQAAELLGIDRTSVTRRIGNGLLYAVRGEGAKFRLPRWQFLDNGETLPGLEKVIPAVPERYPLELIDTFLRTKNESCGELSPIDYLVNGGNAEYVAKLVAELDQW